MTKVSVRNILSLSFRYELEKEGADYEGIRTSAYMDYEYDDV